MDHDQRQFRDQRQRDAIPPGADAVEPRDGTDQPVPRRSWKAWLFAIPIVLFVALGIGWMFYTEPILGGGYPADEARGTSGEVLNPPPEGPAVISDLNLLSNGEDFAGRTARFSAVPVTGKNGDRTFWVGRIGNRTLVLLDRNVASTDAIREGEPIGLAGRIERTPSSEQLDRLGLSENDREAFDGEDVYIRATEIEPVSPDVGAGSSEIPQDQPGGRP
jgi:hypothetical protein